MAEGKLPASSVTIYLLRILDITLGEVGEVCGRPKLLLGSCSALGDPAIGAATSRLLTTLRRAFPWALLASISRGVWGTVASTKMSSSTCRHSSGSDKWTHKAVRSSRREPEMVSSGLRCGPGRPWPPGGPDVLIVIARHNPCALIPPAQTLLSGTTR